MNTVHLERSDETVNAIVRAAFPEYNGKKIRAIISDSVRFSGTAWDDGQRNIYRIVNLDSMTVSPNFPTQPYMQNSPIHNEEHAIPNGFVVVCYTQGYRESVEIIGPSSNLSKMLPKEVELTDDEKAVLKYTSGYKSSYAGISNYRFHEATRNTGITLANWNTAKASLIARKLLNAAGAITVAGRNSIQ